MVATAVDAGDAFNASAIVAIVGPIYKLMLLWVMLLRVRGQQVLLQSVLLLCLILLCVC